MGSLVNVQPKSQVTVIFDYDTIKLNSQPDIGNHRRFSTEQRNLQCLISSLYGGCRTICIQRNIMLQMMCH